MANSSAISVVAGGNAPSTPASDRAPARAEGNEFELAIAALQSEAASFGVRYINDAAVRADYATKTKAAAQELIDLVKARTITPHEGAQTANAMRNQIMELARTRTSDFGKALARDMKPDGLGLATLEEKYAQKLFGKTFNVLSQSEKDAVWVEIIHKAGQANPKVNVRVKLFGMAGRALLVFSLAVAVYNVAESENKPRQATKEGVSLGGGLAGGAVGAVAVGLIVSNPAGWLVGLGIVVGSAVGAIGSSSAFDYFWPDR